MKNLIIRLTVIVAVCSGISLSATAQARMILNGASANITNGAYLVLANPSPDALTRISGSIISEGENNRIKWNIGETTGTYFIPWGIANTDYFPLSFTKTAGTGSTASFLFSTYGTGWDNSQQLPAGITNVNFAGENQSAKLIDRFWQLNASEYAVKPTLTAVSFGYRDAEHLAAGNTILESELKARRWNSVAKTWYSVASTGSADVIANSVMVPTIDASDLYPWWTLDGTANALPLHLLSFTVQKTGTKATLYWTTTGEVATKDFTIERSADGRIFQTIGKKAAINLAGLNNYSYTDILLSGKTFYRIRQNDRSGAYTYSPIRTLSSNADASLHVSPNPVTNGIIQLHASALPTGSYQLSLYDHNGKLVSVITKELSGGTISWKPAKTLTPGSYMLQVKGKETISIKKIVVL